METITVIISITFGIIASFGMSNGFDHKNWKGWFYIGCGFIFGFTLPGGIITGVLAALLTMFGGRYMHKIRQKYNK